MDQSTIDKLKNNPHKLKASSRDFAKSLVTQWDKYGKLSDKQALWAEKLADEIDCFGVPDFTKLFEEPEAKPEYSAIIAFMTNAGKKLKYPAVTLQLKNGKPLKVALNGPGSSKAGAVSMTDGGPYGNNKFYGRIGKDGVFEPYTASVPIQDELARILAAFAGNPAKVAAEHGKLTGRCCFCNTALTDPKSTAVGYGATCAKNFGLPWGAAFKEVA